MDNSIVVSTPPHVKSKRTTKGIMIDVIISLLPAVIAGAVLFGPFTLAIEAVSVATAVLAEFLYYFIGNIFVLPPTEDNKEKKRLPVSQACVNWCKQFDFTSVVTGLILALILPATQDWIPLLYEVIFGNIVAIILVKMIFGGTGKNLVNPAATGRIFMFISFAITSYTLAPQFGSVVDGAQVYTGATHLSGFLLGGISSAEVSLLDLFLGTGVGGCIGETCKLALLVGYLYLVIRKVIKWWQPLLYIVLSAFLSVCLAATVEGANFDIALFPSYALSGGLMFGAIFMATDYVTSPKGIYGQLVYYVALAVLTSLLRFFTKIEVVSFAILLMNLFVPLIDIYIVRKPFGYAKMRRQEK